MTDLFQEPDDATPLESAERDGLLQSWITNRSDLNEAEQENIVKGASWARRRRGLKPADLLNDEFARTLHKQMFGDVWKWAGTYRQTERSIGIDAYRIPTEMAALLDDARYWVDHKTYPADELAARLHHRLTAIHPFPNGNGRHARLMADLLIERLGGEPFSWGGGSLADVGALRAKYVAALKAADGHDIGPLLAFARS
jgi:Fic-DOC domain mobile mystery protein B